MTLDGWELPEGARLHPEALFGTAAVYEVEAPDGSLVRVLDVDGSYQSATYLDERRFTAPFAYLRSFDLLFELSPALPVNRVLMVGGGGFAYPKHMLARHDSVALDVVEIDPAIVAIARDEFYLDEAESRARGRLRVIADDGLSYLRQTVERYDAVLNDAFTAFDPVGACDDGFLRAVRDRLVPGGVYAANVVVEDSAVGAAVLWDNLEAARRVFGWSVAVPSIDEDFAEAENYLVVASSVPREVPGALPPFP